MFEVFLSYTYITISQLRLLSSINYPPS